MIHLQRVLLVSVAACVWLAGAERKPFSLGAPECHLIHQCTPGGERIRSFPPVRQRKPAALSSSTPCFLYAAQGSWFFGGPAFGRATPCEPREAQLFTGLTDECSPTWRDPSRSRAGSRLS